MYHDDSHQPVGLNNIITYYNNKTSIACSENIIKLNNKSFTQTCCTEFPLVSHLSRLGNFIQSSREPIRYINTKSRVYLYWAKVCDIRTKLWSHFNLFEVIINTQADRVVIDIHNKSDNFEFPFVLSLYNDNNNSNRQ